LSKAPRREATPAHPGPGETVAAALPFMVCFVIGTSASSAAMKSAFLSVPGRFLLWSICFLGWHGELFAIDCFGALFTCESDRAGKYISICATEVEPGRRWENIQYQFGAENQAPELVFPVDASKGASLMYFSHVKSGSDYRVSVRFSNGGYTYRVFSTTGPDLAGVSVTDSRGKLISLARCVERPRVFPSYLQRALACDLENPHGRAACGDRPYVERR